MPEDRKSRDTRAYVMIDTEPELTGNVVQVLRRRKDIPLADAVNGPHGAIAVVEGTDAAAVATTILVNIRKIEGVKDITVYLAMPHEENVAPVAE